MHLPEGVTEESISATSSSDDGQNVVTYQIRLRAETAGKFALDPVEVLYTPRGESAPVASQVSGPTIEIAARRIAGLAPAHAVAVGSAAALLAIAFVGWGRRKRARNGAALDGEDARFAELEERLERAKRARIEGDAHTFLKEISAIGQALGTEDEAERAELEEALERARYGGQRPPAEVLDRLERRAERSLTEARPEPDRQARRALRLNTDAEAPSRPTR